jgi:hypothetical protein
MKRAICFDRMDLVVMAGALTVIAGAAFFFAYLGVAREPLTIPEAVSPTAFLEDEMAGAIEKAVVTPAAVIEERERTQAALGEAIKKLTQAKLGEEGFISDLAGHAAAGARARREFLESKFKLPSDWDGLEFALMARNAEAIAQEELGRTVVNGTRAAMTRLAEAEVNYGLAVRDATLALNRESIEPAASQATMVAAATVLKDLAKRTPSEAAAPIMRGAGLGYASIGEGIFLPLVIMGAAVLVLFGVGATMMMEGRFATRTMAGHCDEHEKDVVVKMLVSDDTPYKVVHCSAFNGGPVTCDEDCLRWPLAHAA